MNHSFTIKHQPLPLHCGEIRKNKLITDGAKSGYCFWSCYFFGDQG